MRAVAIRAIGPRDPSVHQRRVRCFRPEPLTIAEVARLLGGTENVITASPEELGAAPAVLRALLPLVERRDPRGEEAIVGLAARAVGVMKRTLASINDATETASRAALLEELAPP